MKTIEIALFALLPALPTASAQEPGSHTPPDGPPWTKDFFEARERALESGKPIFLYSTKTH